MTNGSCFYSVFKVNPDVQCVILYDPFVMFEITLSVSYMLLKQKSELVPFTLQTQIKTWRVFMTQIDKKKKRKHIQMKSYIVKFFLILFTTGYKLNIGLVERAPEPRCIQRILDQNQLQDV